MMPSIAEPPVPSFGGRRSAELIAPVLGTSTAQKLTDAVLAIETVKDIRTLRPLL